MKALDQVNKRFGKVQSAARGFNEATKKVTSSANSVSASFKNAIPHMFKFANSLARIAKYRIMRGILKSITSGLKEGLENVYQYSNGMAGEAHRMAATLDSLSTANQTMKNQIGSAWSELLAIIIPVINAILSKIREFVDGMSQLFAALGGNSSYYKATDATKKFAKATAGGAKAAKELRNTLMGFDEINRLDAPNNSGGGGGGSTGNDMNNMFDYTKISDNMRNVAEIIKQNMPMIEAAFAGFELGLGAILFFTGAAPLIGLALMVDGARRLAKSVKMDWSSVNADLANSVANAMAIVAAGLFALGAIMLFAGHPVIGIGMILASGAMGAGAGVIWGKVNNDVRGSLANLLGLGALLTMGLGIILMFAGHPGLGIAMLIAGGAMGVTAIAINWNAILEKLKSTWNNIKNWWNTGVGKYFTYKWWDDLFKNSILAPIESACKAIGDWVDKILGFFEKLFQPREFPLKVDLWASGSFSGAGMPNIPMFANGGTVPEDGLFMMNHNELIGQFANGQTAVANNESIIAGIEAGVYRAMMNAMSGQSGSREIRVYLDGKEIGAASRKYERNISRATGVALA